MDLDCFRRRFYPEVLLKAQELQKISNIQGTNSAIIQHTLNLAMSCLKGTEEAYFEVGCLNGASLDAASRGNDEVIKYACDWTLFGGMPGLIQSIPNLTFHKGNYFELDLSSFLKNPVAVYYYDSDHDREPTYRALEMIIPYLADKALVIMDDLDGYSRIYNAWREFARKHSDQFTIVHEFWTPDQFRACTVGYDTPHVWDGLGIMEFEREFAERDESIEDIAISVWHGTGEIGRGRQRHIYPRELRHIHGKDEIKI